MFDGSIQGNKSGFTRPIRRDNSPFTIMENWIKPHKCFFLLVLDGGRNTRDSHAKERNAKTLWFDVSDRTKLHDRMNKPYRPLDFFLLFNKLLSRVRVISSCLMIVYYKKNAVSLYAWNNNVSLQSSAEFLWGAICFELRKKNSRALYSVKLQSNFPNKMMKETLHVSRCYIDAAIYIISKKSGKKN